MDTVESRIEECRKNAQKYNKWLNYLKIPNTVLIGGGSFLSFLGGAAIVNDKWKEFAGYLALVGGTCTGLHGWLGCAIHQQKCRSTASKYYTFAMRYEKLKLEKLSGIDISKKLHDIDNLYFDFKEQIDATPWI